MQRSADCFCFRQCKLLLPFMTLRFELVKITHRRSITCVIGQGGKSQAEKERDNPSHTQVGG